MNESGVRVRILPILLGDNANIGYAMNRMAPARELIGDLAEFTSAQVITTENADRFVSSTPGDYDALAVAMPLAVRDYAEVIASVKKPVMFLEPSCAFHPYQAGARAALLRAGAVVLPTDCPEAMVSSARAVIAAKRLRAGKAMLFVADPDKDARLADTAQERLGVTVEIHPVEYLKDEARRISDATAAATLARWKETSFSRIDGVDDQHLIGVAKLYHAEKALLESAGANALGVEEFGPFLFQKLPMPNVTYALLKDEGFVCTEEADLGCLLTQMLFHAVAGAQNTMSNIYMAFRTEREKCGSDYTPEKELADYRECLRDNCVVISHFSTAGSLPKNMMVEEKWEVRETIGAWPGQSMVYSTPKTGPVTLGRLHDDLANFDIYPGDTAEVRKLDSLGWHRCRWLVRLNSAKTFMETAISHHFAIAPGHPDPALRILAERLLGICIREY